MKEKTIKKSSRRAGKESRNASRELSIGLMTALADTLMAPGGMEAAASALAMTWATLRDVARMEGTDVTRLFEREVKHWALKMHH